MRSELLSDAGKLSLLIVRERGVKDHSRRPGHAKGVLSNEPTNVRSNGRRARRASAGQQAELVENSRSGCAPKEVN